MNVTAGIELQVPVVFKNRLSKHLWGFLHTDGPASRKEAIPSDLSETLPGIFMIPTAGLCSNPDEI